MKFCIPTKGARIVLSNDLVVNTDDYYSRDFIKYKACAKEAHKSTFYNGRDWKPDGISYGGSYIEKPRGEEYTYYQKLPCNITLPKGTILKIEGVDQSFVRAGQSYDIQIKFSISETSLEEESFPVYTSSNEWADEKQRKKANKKKAAKFRLGHEEYKDLEFEFAV